MSHQYFIQDYSGITLFTIILLGKLKKHCWQASFITSCKKCISLCHMFIIYYVENINEKIVPYILVSLMEVSIRVNLTPNSHKSNNIK